MIFTRAAVVAGILAAMIVSDTARAQPVEEFYKGKDIRILIGAGVGGTYHLYAMLAARHMRKHIPGNPTLTLLPMPGAGGITAMNHSYNVAPKDGTLMHLIHAEVLFETLLSPGVKFNAKDYSYIGRFADADFAGMVSKQSGREDARRRQEERGDLRLYRPPQRDLSRPGDVQPHRRHAVQGDRRLQGHLRHRHRAERGEVDGVALSWASVTSVHGQKYANGDIIPVFAVADGRMKAIPDVPSMTEFGRDDAEKTFLGIYTSSGTIGRALVFPPGVPADRVAALRAAYEKTIRDPEFLAEVKQRKSCSTRCPARTCRPMSTNT